MKIKKTTSRQANQPTLKRKVERLSEEIQKLRDENALLKSKLGLALFGKPEMDKEALMAQFGKRPSILDMIEELKRDGD